MLSYLSLALYVTSLLLYVWWLVKGNRAGGRIATAALAASIVLHFCGLLERARLSGSVPYHDLYGSMSLFAWFLAVTYLGMERFHRQRSLAPFVLPFVIIFELLGMLLAPLAPTPSPARGPVFALHITTNILAYAAFALSFVMGAVYIGQNRLLRERKPGLVIWQFPALEVVERMMRSSVIIGLIGLAAGTAFGLVWLERLQGRYFTLDAKEIASIIIFVVYAVYVWLSLRPGWRGARAAVLCVLSFSTVIFSYTVVNIFLSRFHRYF